MSRISEHLDSAWPQMAGRYAAHKNFVAVNLNQKRKHMFLVMLVTAVVFNSVFTTTFARATEPHPQGFSAKHVSSMPLGNFLGSWRSQDREDSLVISSAKMVSTSQRRLFNDVGEFLSTEKTTAKARWSNLTSSNEDETFGLRKTSTTLAEISKRYEMVLKRYKKDPSDFSMGDPKLSRKAIQAMSPGTYQVMWSYFGGESGEEYIVDKDHMLKIKDDPYGFSVTLFDRVK